MGATRPKEVGASEKHPPRVRTSPPIEHAARLQEDAAQASTIFRLVANPVRLHLLLALSQGEQDVGALRELSGLSRLALGHHLALLRLGGLIRPRREADRSTYQLSELGLRVAELSPALGSSPPEPERPAPSPRRIDAALLKDVGGFVDDAEAWFETPNPYFEGRRPSALLGTPEEPRLRNRIQAAKLGMFS